MAKIENFSNYTDSLQRNVTELVDWFSSYIKGQDIEQAVIVFRDAEDGLCFIAGARDRDFTFSDINWDLGQAQSFLMNDNYDEE